LWWIFGSYAVVMAFNDPARLLSEIVTGFPSSPNPVPANPLSDDEIAVTARAAKLLLQVERCASALEVGGEDVTDLRQQFGMIWGCICLRRQIHDSGYALAVLRTFGLVISRAGLVPKFTAARLGEVAGALQDLEDLVRGDESVSGDLREKLLSRIADARKACDDIELVGPVSVEESLNDVAGAALRFGDASGKEPVKERVANALRVLMVTTVAGLPLEIASKAADIAIGS